jgi:hypothetical protein
LDVIENAVGFQAAESYKDSYGLLKNFFL